MDGMRIFDAILLLLILLLACSSVVLHIRNGKRMDKLEKGLGQYFKKLDAKSSPR